MWYRDGLAFECTRCGNCCTGGAGYVWVTEEEVAAIAAHRGHPAEQAVPLFARRVGTRTSLREKPSGDCVFYEAGRGCTIYSVRPFQCRSYPFWASHVGTPEAWRETCRECPGAGHGTPVSAEEITRLTRETERRREPDS